MRRLKTITVRNFKSIRAQTLHLGSQNVFIGANGSGKSNLIEAFRFVREIVRQNLAESTIGEGGARALLHYGGGTSNGMTFELDFADGSASSSYAVSLLSPNAEDFVITTESAYSDAGQMLSMLADRPRHPRRISTQSRESALRDSDDPQDRQLASDLEDYGIYHFHDTGRDAGIRGSCDLTDYRRLRSHGENLAALLYRLQQKHPRHFDNIRDTVRQIAPPFDDFLLRPSQLYEGKICLEWKEVGTDSPLSASSLSDGTLRFICLATLLMQPDLPAMLLLDEPELGLHPAAVTILASLLSSAATRTQVIVATQSVTLVNQLEPDDVWTAERSNGQTVFHHLSEGNMTGWLDDYALGELWEKNVLGARP